MPRRARLTVRPPGSIRPAVRRFSVSQITTLHWPFERDVEMLAAAGAPAIGVAVGKLEAYGGGPAARALREAGLPVSCLPSSGPIPLGDAAAERAALAVTRRHLAAAAELGADCLMLLPGGAPALSWEEAAGRVRPLLEALLPDAE